MNTDDGPISILFLCMGNICRSPAAHCVFQDMVDRGGLSDHYMIDSAGTINYHAGNAPDSRMQAVLRKAGIPVIGRSRALGQDDFFTFDQILCMDDNNYADAAAIRPAKGKGKAALRKFASLVTSEKVRQIPDPYYGDDGFEHVLSLVQNGCANLLTELEAMRSSGKRSG